MANCSHMVFRGYTVVRTCLRAMLISQDHHFKVPAGCAGHNAVSPAPTLNMHIYVKRCQNNLQTQMQMRSGHASYSEKTLQRLNEWSVQLALYMNELDTNLYHIPTPLSPTLRIRTARLIGAFARQFTKICTEREPTVCSTYTSTHTNTTLIPPRTQQHGGPHHFHSPRDRLRPLLVNSPKSLQRENWQSVLLALLCERTSH